MGPQGEAGPRGEPGPIGPGIQPVYFNAVMQGGFQTVAPEDNVRFLLAFQSGDFSFTPNTSEITVNTEGIYRIDYTLLIRPAAGLENIAYAVAINGVENPLSFFGIYSDDAVNTERAELTGMFITSITAGSTVVLRNKSSSADYLAGTGIDNQAVNHAAIYCSGLPDGSGPVVISQRAVLHEKTGGFFESILISSQFPYVLCYTMLYEFVSHCFSAAGFAISNGNNLYRGKLRGNHTYGIFIVLKG